MFLSWLHNGQVWSPGILLLPYPKPKSLAMNGAREIVEWVGLVAAENLVELPEGPLKPPVSLPPVSLPLERVVRFILPRVRITPESVEGDLKCSLCDQLFKFRSKYSRHLESSHHTRFQQSLDVVVIWMLLMVQARVQVTWVYQISFYQAQVHSWQRMTSLVK